MPLQLSSRPSHTSGSHHHNNVTIAPPPPLTYRPAVVLLPLLQLSPRPSRTPGSHLAPASDARQTIADHGWALLEDGRLGALARLSASLTFLPGGLVGGGMKDREGKGYGWVAARVDGSCDLQHLTVPHNKFFNHCSLQTEQLVCWVWVNS